MNVERFLASNGDNYNYLVFSDKGSSAIAVDPLDVDRLVKLAASHGKTISHILITHSHADHVGGAEALAKRTGAEIVGHAAIHVATKQVGDKEKFLCDTIIVETIATPGHTSDSICYRIDNGLFTGDTVFYAGAGNCHSGSADDLYESFSQKILKLPAELFCYPGHEYALRNLEFAQSIEPENEAIQQRIVDIRDTEQPLSTLGDEQIYNPFFRFTNESYQEALEKKLGHIINDQKEVFLLTRELRNRW